jgi:hypothetical protein
MVTLLAAINTQTCREAITATSFSSFPFVWQLFLMSHHPGFLPGFVVGMQLPEQLLRV